jgi:hypothetical protein
MQQEKIEAEQKSRQTAHCKPSGIMPVARSSRGETMSDLLHEKYIVDEHGEPTAIILDLPEFTRLIKAASEANVEIRAALDEMAGRSAQLRILLEELEDGQAFDEALAAPPEDREKIPFDQAVEIIEQGRK